jgi:hypothetical protein
MRPSDTSCASADALVPLAAGLPRRGRLFLATPRLRPLTRDVSGGLVTGAPFSAGVFEDARGSPRFLGRPLHTRRIHTPRQVQSDSRPFDSLALAFRGNHPLGTWYHGCFRGWLNTARAFAYLRIGIPVNGRCRKARFRVVGWTFPGRDSHPLDGKPNFGSYRITSSFRTRISWSHGLGSRPRQRTARPVGKKKRPHSDRPSLLTLASRSQFRHSCAPRRCVAALDPGRSGSAR